ncbi:MAG: type VI secretion system protein TssA [Thermoanaerobaculia bacterium]
MTAQILPFAGAPVDVDALLIPISAENPAGEWLRFDPVYDEIQRLRQEDDPALPLGVWQRELKRADWRGVERLCIEVLTRRSKDLQVAAWLSEAWLHLHGFNGFASGAHAVASLCRDFWPDLYPALEDGSCEYRIAPISWLTRLTTPMLSIPLTHPTTEEPAAHGWKEWTNALRLAKIAVKDQQAMTKAQAAGTVTQQKFLVAVSLTPGAWYAALNEELAAGLTALDELDAVVTEKCGAQEAPSLTPLRELLQSIQAFAARVIRERTEKGELTSPDEPPSPVVEEPMIDTTESASSTPPTPRLVVGPIASRADAYRALTDASEYLMRTEPHSPVPYLIRRAISWGNMSLVELLEELLQKNADINTVYALLGMKRPS